MVANTTTEHRDMLASDMRHEPGGLSGAPLFAPSTDLLRRLYGLTQGRLPLIGVGGISGGRDAYAKIRAGASLVQLYTALVYQGPGLVDRINLDLDRYIERDGFAGIAEAVGADAV